MRILNGPNLINSPSSAVTDSFFFLSLSFPSTETSTEIQSQNPRNPNPNSTKCSPNSEQQQRASAKLHPSSSESAPMLTSTTIPMTSTSPRSSTASSTLRRSRPWSASLLWSPRALTCPTYSLRCESWCRSLRLELLRILLIFYLFIAGCEECRVSIVGSEEARLLVSASLCWEVSIVHFVLLWDFHVCTPLILMFS